MGILAFNIASLRKRTGLTLEQLSVRLRVGKTTISNIESGYITALPEKLLSDIALLFDTTVDGLLGIAPLDVSERARMVYVVESIDGGSTLINYDKIVGSVFIDRDKLRGYEHFGFSARDNSMANRRILAGDIVIVRRDCPLKNNDIVIATTPESPDAVLRTYHKTGNLIILKAESDSSLYNDITFCEGDPRFKLIGKVVKCEFEL